MRLPSALTLLFFAAVLGCEDTKSVDTAVAEEELDPIDTFVAVVDQDGDGITEGDGDCDDADPDVFPGQEESCNELDDNCNDLVDEGFADTDADGLPDCRDLEECDGVDNDGDGEVDEDFADADADGIADCVGTESCDGVDNDGDGAIDEGFDADGDGYTQCGSATREADCDDSDATIHPGAGEAAGDLVDNDCDGSIDEGGWVAGELTITEIMTNPSYVSDPHGEWFEVVNTGDRTLLLNGIVITSTVDDDYHVVDTEELLVLEPEESFVFGSDADTTTNGQTPVGYAYAGVSLSNESDSLVLQAEAVMIDSVSWDDGVTMPDPVGASMSLEPTHFDPILNDDPSAWCASTQQWGLTTDKGSPGEINEVCSTIDHDADGYTVDDGDCDDDDATTFPGAPELTEGVDNDCDGDAERMPVADPAYTAGSMFTCDALLLDGTGSSDPDGDALTYEWELVSAPDDSALTTADLDTSTDASPTFTPDVPGVYTFILTVNDGGTDSYPEVIAVVISERPYNTEPLADAGGDQTYDGTSTCQAWSYGEYYTCPACASYAFTLDGSGSVDGDDDALTYSWEVTGGSGSATLTDDDTATATATVDGAAVEYGGYAETDVDVTLTVTDCMGATHSETVTLTYTCTGG